MVKEPGYHLDSLRPALAGSEVVVSPDGEGDACRSGILIFDRVTPELNDVLRERSRTGLVRIVALATESKALAKGDSWRLLQSGAADVLAWDRSADPGADVVARLRRWALVDALVESDEVGGRLIGRGVTWTLMLRRIVAAAAFTDAPVLLMGESGTGKELAARVIHEVDPRPDKGRLVVLDCATVVPSLSGSEFFGHEKGAFTGAIGIREGAFALADQGTLFLDEVGELPLPLQAELLRVIQEGMYKRVGSNVWRHTRFRLVGATNLDLVDAVRAGRFRQDLYHRIAGWVFRLPSLRQRFEDIPVLARHFLASIRPDNNNEMDECVEDFLCRRVYQGNVRELRQLISRMCSRHEGHGPLTVGDIPPEDRWIDGEPDPEWGNGDFERSIRRALAGGATLEEIKKSAAETAIRIAIAEENGNLQRASRRLGVTDRALQLRTSSKRSQKRIPGPVSGS